MTEEEKVISFIESDKVQFKLPRKSGLHNKVNTFRQLIKTHPDFEFIRKHKKYEFKQIINSIYYDYLAKMMYLHELRMITPVGDKVWAYDKSKGLTELRHSTSTFLAFCLALCKEFNIKDPLSLVSLRMIICQYHILYNGRTWNNGNDVKNGYRVFERYWFKRMFFRIK